MDISTERTIRHLVCYIDFETANALAKVYQDVEEDKEICNHYTILFDLMKVERFSQIEDEIRNNLFTANIPTELQIKYCPRFDFYTAMRNAAVSGNLDFVRHFGSSLDDVHKDYYERFAFVCGRERIFPETEEIVGRGVEFTNVDPRLLKHVIPKRFPGLWLGLQSYIAAMSKNGMSKKMIKRIPKKLLKDNDVKLTIYESSLLSGRKNILTRPPSAFSKIPGWSIENFHEVIVSSHRFPFNLQTVKQVEFFRDGIEELLLDEVEYEDAEIRDFNAFDKIVEIMNNNPLRYPDISITIPIDKQLEILTKHFPDENHFEYLFENMTYCYQEPDRQDYFLESYNKYLEVGGETDDDDFQQMIDVYNENLPLEFRIEK